MKDFEFLKESEFYLCGEDSRLNYMLKRLEGNKEYIELENGYEKLYKKLLDILPEEEKGILVDYADAVDNAISQERIFFYRSGFADGARLIKGLLGVKEINCTFNLCEI